MASTKTLNAKNLETLGQERLAALLMEVATGDARIKRRLRLALAGDSSAGDAAHEIGKRLASITRARGRIDWRRVKPLATDLAAQHHAIRDLVAPSDPRAALELMWRLLRCAESMFDRCADGGGLLAEMFAAAMQDIPAIAVAAHTPPESLAEHAIEVIRDDSHGALDDLVAVLAPVLGDSGIDRLRTLAMEWQANRSGPARDARQAASLLRQIADASGDVDGFIAQIAPATRSAPAIAAEIADRLLAADRLDEAWAAIEATRVGRHDPLPRDWERVRLAVLEALGRHDDAQAYRWERFEAVLDADHLRAHLKKLPDFDDFAAEQRALAYARTYRDVHLALQFLVDWPARDKAAALVLANGDRIDGNRYEILSPAADALAEKYPLAATVLHRAMIDFTLGKARSSRYGHAARHLADCARLAPRIDDFGDQADHAAYLATLRSDHARKAGFWDAVDDA